ncbi:WhiB family transcriptional regulator [Georgenia sp. Z1491]|uniref:WhiB family transcriptional regulator n=1 Tax=Georgenia sp. Z1491 TaxID=3416707 RepID=UPI003CF6C5F1
MSDASWTMRAACADLDPDVLFAEGPAQRQVRSVCFACPVRLECLADALEAGPVQGVWGGLTERERRALQRRYPAVTSWSEALRREDDAVIAQLRQAEAPRLLMARATT